jgi:AraC-like DNA-binding protein
MIDPELFSRPRLDVPIEEDDAAPIVAQAGVEEQGRFYSAHSHARAQLFHIVRGSLIVETEHGKFVVPPERALWIPPSVAHAVTYLRDSSLRYLYFRPETVMHLSARPSVTRLSPLMRELITAFMAYPRGETDVGPAARIAAVILDQMSTDPIMPLHLPMPTSERLRRAIEELEQYPDRLDTLPDIAGRAAMSERSFERRFRAETGLSFRAWRRQAKLVKAIELLSQGLPVTDVADRLGYEGVSAFIQSFRSAFGTTPGRYFRKPD